MLVLFSGALRASRPTPLMVKIKPSGMPLRAWRTLTPDEQRSALGQLNGDFKHRHGSRQALLVRLQAVAHERQHNAVLAPSQRPNNHKSQHGSRRKRSKRVRLTGALDGWEREDRCTSSGRKYSVWIGPRGTALTSLVQVMRWCERWG